MKIGLVKRTFRLQGGGERQIAYLIEGLLARGYEVELLSQHPPAGTLAANVHWRQISTLPTPPALRTLSFALGTRAVIRRGDLTLVQSFERTLGQQIYRAGEGVHREWLARKRPTLSPLARGWSYIRPVDRVMLALERRVFKETPYIITNSMQARQDIMRHYATPGSRLQVIYNGVDHTRFHPSVRMRFREQQRAAWGVAADEMVLLLVGSGFHRKGLGYMVQAVGELHRRGIANVRAVVVGKGHSRPYQRLAATLGVADRVHFAGLCPGVERYYAAADVLVLPTLYDPFANACLEAMACGLPVLTTEANGAAELLHDGINGCVLKTPLSAETLVERLYDLLPSQRRQALAEAGYHTACEYPFSQALDQTLRVYESALAWHGHTG